MIEVLFGYKIVTGEWKQGSKYFDDVEKAIRFIYKVIRDKNKVYMGFSCEDNEVCEYINWRVK